MSTTWQSATSSSSAASPLSSDPLREFDNRASTIWNDTPGVEMNRIFSQHSDFKIWHFAHLQSSKISYLSKMRQQILKWSTTTGTSVSLKQIGSSAEQVLKQSDTWSASKSLGLRVADWVVDATTPTWRSTFGTILTVPWRSAPPRCALQRSAPWRSLPWWSESWRFALWWSMLCLCDSLTKSSSIAFGSSNVCCTCC